MNTSPHTAKQIIAATNYEVGRKVDFSPWSGYYLQVGVITAINEETVSVEVSGAVVDCNPLDIWQITDPSRI